MDCIPGTPRTRIMLVDDSSTIRRCAEILLTQAGYEVFTAHDGFDALAKIYDFRPDLILIDVLMPRLNGYETCALIRRNSTFRDLPVVMLTAKDSAQDRDRSAQAGADAHLTKPFSKEGLMGVVDGLAGARVRLAA